jgi:hypothetical protein
MMSASEILTGHLKALQEIQKMKRRHVEGLTIHIGLGGNAPTTRVQVTDGTEAILKSIEQALLDTMKLTAIITKQEEEAARNALESYAQVVPQSPE